MATTSRPSLARFERALQATPRPLARIALAALVILASVLLTGTCRADDDHAASRRIGDTTFLLPALADSAFIVTELGLRQDVSYERIPQYPVGASARYDLSWASLDERLDVAVRLRDWLGLYIQGVAAGTVGVDLPSLIFSGGGYTFSGKGGGVARLFRSDSSRTQLSVRAYGAAGTDRSLDLLGLFGAVSVRTGRDLQSTAAQNPSASQLQAIVQNELLSLASQNYTDVALTRGSWWAVGGSVHLAQAIAGPLTLQVSAGLEETLSQSIPFDPNSQHYVTLSSSQTSFSFDGTLSLDLSRWAVPVGFSAEYTEQANYGTVSGRTAVTLGSQQVGGGVFYTGRRGLQLGLLGFTSRDLKPMTGYQTGAVSENPTGYMGSFVLRALW
jgi:hypothetical protein